MSLDNRYSVGRFSLDSPERYLWTVPFLGAVAVYVAYLLGHPYPSYGAGLYLETADQIVANAYRPPTFIPGYAGGDVPFAYPPLAFYLVALLRDVGGVAAMDVALFVPGLVVVAYAFPAYAIANELTDDPRQAAVAALVLVTSPTVLQWHLSAGGIVRATAFLFALVSIYVALRLFRTHDPRWMAAGAFTFGLVVLTHPTYTVFVVLSYLAVYAALDRSLYGLFAGAVAGVGGLVVAAPWVGHVAAVHGIEVFVDAAGSHGGIGSVSGLLWSRLTSPLYEWGIETPFYAAVYAGVGYALWKRRWFLPAWALAAVLAIPKPRFLFVPGAVLVGVFVVEALGPAVQRAVDGRAAPRPAAVASAAAVVVVVLAAVMAGTLYGAGAVTGLRDSPSQPQFVDAEDDEAMAWVERNTPPDATFVVLGDAAEWHPFLSNRTLLVGPWGVEWKNASGYYTQFERQQALSVCSDADCITRILDRGDVHPDYVYVPKGQYTVFNKAYHQPPSMKTSLEESDRFRVVYENEGVVIAEYRDASESSTTQPDALDDQQGDERQHGGE